MKINKIFFAIILFSSFGFAHDTHQSKGTFEDKFRQLEERFPDPNQYRPATGETGKAYWQQKRITRLILLLMRIIDL